MTIRFPGPRLPTAGLPDPEDIRRFNERRDQEELLEAAAEGEPERRAKRNELRTATRSAIQADLKV